MTIPWALYTELFGTVFNVRAYGAKGDGVADDTAPFRAALSDVSRHRGGTMVVPDGDYRITNVLSESLTNTAIVGLGRARVIQATRGRGVFHFPSASRVRIANIWLYGPNSPVETPSETAIRIDAGRDVTVESCTIERFALQGIRSSADETSVIDSLLIGLDPPSYGRTTHVGIQIVNGSRAYIAGNRVEFSQVGINTQGTGQYHRVVNNLVRAGAGIDASLYVAAGNYSIVANNVIIGTTPTGYGIKMGFGAIGPIVKGNVCVNQSIFVNESYGAVIEGNTVDGGAIAVSQDVAGRFAVGARVLGNVVQNGVNDGIYARGKYLTIAGNFISRAQFNGINIASTDTSYTIEHVLVQNNTIVDCGQRAENSYSDINLGDGNGESFGYLAVIGNILQAANAGGKTKHGMSWGGGSGLRLAVADNHYVNRHGISDSNVPVELLVEGLTTESPIAGAGLELPIVAVTTSYTLTARDFTVLGDANRGVVRITLPSARRRAGRLYTIKKTDRSANPVVVEASAGQTIDGDMTKLLTAPNQFARVQADGENWFVV